jgi:putative (di)nucleoside polyphosphate hydrolase
MALTELARFLPRGTHHNRYLRSGMRPHHRDEGPMHHDEQRLQAPAGDVAIPPDTLPD